MCCSKIKISFEEIPGKIRQDFCKKLSVVKLTQSEACLGTSLSFSETLSSVRSHNDQCKRANLPTQANTRPNLPIKKMKNNQKIEVVTLDTDTDTSDDDDRTTVKWSSSSSSSSSSEDEIQVIGTRKVARVSRQSFTSRRVENSSNHFTRNYFRGRDVTSSLNRNLGKSFGTSNSSARGRDVTNFSGKKHNAKVTGGSRQLDLYYGKGNVTQNSSRGRDVTNSINRNFSKSFDKKDAKARSQAISNWIQELHN